MFKKIALTRSALKKAIVVVSVCALASFLLLLYWNDSSESTKPSSTMAMGIYNTHIVDGSLDGGPMSAGDSVRDSAIPVK